ncbi:MAG: pilus assembly protein TadG-related protein [Afipia sp.]
MFAGSLLKQSRCAAARFRRAESGNVAVFFAIAILPMLALVGAAIDYARVNNARTALQTALDTAALMVSKDAAAGTLSDDQVTAKAQAYFKALYNHPEAPVGPISAKFTPNTGKGATIALSGGGAMQTDFMKVAGFPTINFGSSSTTTWGNTKLRVAIALDITGSMNSSGKLPAMKTAAIALINKLKDSAKTTDDVYISIIPFNVMVNLGSQAGTIGSSKLADYKSWLDWNTTYGSCSKSTRKTRSSCTAAGGTWTANSSLKKWKGCVADRGASDSSPSSGDYDTNNAAPDSSTPATLFPAREYVDYWGNNVCGSSILPMTSAYTATESDSSIDDTTLKGKINNLVAGGATNQAIGMFWAWMSLQKGDPLNTPAKDPNYIYTDAIILLSDGMNTQDRWYGDGSNWSSSVDARQKMLCDNIKDIKNGKTAIYTIQVNTDGDPESAVLKYCADSGAFFPTTTASGIGDAFTQIGASLLKLRIAK